jgi:hypothetical protein
MRFAEEAFSAMGRTDLIERDQSGGASQSGGMLFFLMWIANTP